MKNLKLLFISIFSLVFLTGFGNLQMGINPNFSKYNNEKITIKRIIKINEKINEASAIAYDNDEEILYIVTDRGFLYHLELTFKDREPIATKVINKYKIKPIKDVYKLDTEGLVLQNSDDGIKGNSKLIISFERTPKIGIFNSKGKEIKDIKLSAKLLDCSLYTDNNKMLEAVSYHKDYGIVTAPENSYENYHTIYSLDGREWKFDINANISDFDFTKDGALLVIQRNRTKVKTSGKKKKKITTNFSLKKVYLKNCTDICKSEEILNFNTPDFLIQNYEGLTHLKDDMFLMTNDNGSDGNTYIVVFELK